MTCHFGCPDALGIFELSRGCVVYLDQRQALCFHHALRARDNGALAGIQLVEDLTLDGSFTKAWNE